MAISVTRFTAGASHPYTKIITNHIFRHNVSSLARDFDPPDFPNFINIFFGKIRGVILFLRRLPPFRIDLGYSRIILKIDSSFFSFLFFKNMELPEDILSLVRQFSRPLSRPDWRNIRPMTSRHFHQAIQRTYNALYLPVIESFVLRYDQIQYIYDFDPYNRHHTILRFRTNHNQY